MKHVVDQATAAAAHMKEAAFKDGMQQIAHHSAQAAGVGVNAMAAFSSLPDNWLAGRVHHPAHGLRVVTTLLVQGSLCCYRKQGSRAWCIHVTQGLLYTPKGQ
jgi:hypothetical protein